MILAADRWRMVASLSLLMVVLNATASCKKKDEAVRESLTAMQRTRDWLDQRPSFPKVLHHWSQAWERRQQEEDSAWDCWIADGKRIAGAGACLTAILEQEKDCPQRHTIVVLLGDLGGKESVPVLQKFLLSPAAERETRFFAAMALTKIGTPEAIRALKGTLSQIDKDMRSEICSALAPFKDVQTQESEEHRSARIPEFERRRADLICRMLRDHCR